MKPYSESCERNQAHILEILTPLFADRTRVLEIASGTGQHAVYFGQALPHLIWQTSELEENHAGIRAWLAESVLDNVLLPIALDVNDSQWSLDKVDAVFNANTVHIVSWQEVERMFENIGKILEPGGILCLYGPFNYNGQYTSESNARFDDWLKGRNAKSAIRDFEAVNKLAESQGMVLVQDEAMPANNRILAWKK
ncbi:DUF938 domain-containing protein [Sulfurirhabdus autotrophica]|uniref:Uncharacterized protein DUF938 n=1 Tax=Sulfurirhabdus autotrophica TaxID=1706046 RepID=A0A4R3YCL6_9PROT|nr:DUF938 domain-containing protein [Sulfurirhabdus autotrophica]TCV89581.1 uncharacterized protein DUF938 [Sulfurirhabdus autotrophica]